MQPFAASPAPDSSSASGFVGAAPAPRRWLEFVLTGGSTLLVLALGRLLGVAVEPDTSLFWVSWATFHGAILVNDPHFASSYLLLYPELAKRLTDSESPPLQRLRYVWAGLVAPLLLIAWVLTSFITRDAVLLGYLIQLMFLLVSWHYVKQGFGVWSVLSARRGVRYTELERRGVLAHCFAAWAFAWSRRASAGGEFSDKGVVYTAPAHPQWLYPAACFLFWTTFLTAAALLIRKWRRDGQHPPLTALFGLLTSLWAWTVFSDMDPFLMYCIPALHSLQYLYFVALRVRGDATQALTFRSPRTRQIRFAVGAVALGVVMLRVTGEALDVVFPVPPDTAQAWRFGDTPLFAALVTIVNLHHYFIDNVIWRRDSPAVRALAAAPR